MLIIKSMHLINLHFWIYLTLFLISGSDVLSLLNARSLTRVGNQDLSCEKKNPEGVITFLVITGGFE